MTESGPDVPEPDVPGPDVPGPDVPGPDAPDSAATQGIGRGSHGTQRSMRHTTARGVVWSFGSSASQAILQIVSLAVLGRLLVPSEFGLVAAASLVIGFTTTIGQVGVTAALVQKPQLSQKEVGAGFVVAIVTSFILAGIVWLAIPLLTPLLGLPHNSTVLRLLVIAIPIAGFGAVPLGLLQRQLRFRTLASVDVSAFVLGVVGVSIALALLGFGAYSLVWGQLTTATVQAVGYLLRAKARPRLGRPREIAVSATELLRFGLPYSIGQIGNWIAGNGDNFIVATQLNATSLGIYSRAFQLLAAPANLIGGVADRVLFPAMSAVQHDTVRMTRAYVTSSTFVAMLTVPASIALFSSAPDLVRLLLGPGWNSVVMPLQVFAIVLPARASYRISGSFTRARGAVRGGAVRQWMYAVEVVVGCFIGSHWGVEGVAIGASVAMVLHYFVMLHFSAQVAPGLRRMLAKAYVRYIPLTLAGVAAAIIAVYLVSGLGIPILRFLIVWGCVGIATLAVVILFRRRFADELSLVGSILRRPTAPVTTTPEPGELSQPDAADQD